jgi:hypothetical protein
LVVCLPINPKVSSSDPGTAKFFLNTESSLWVLRI